MPKVNTLSLKIRKDIYDYIRDHPGIHLRKLSRDMKISKTTLSYHVDKLIKSDLVTASNINCFQRLYILESSVVKYKKILDVLRNKTQRYILLATFVNIVSSRQDLIEALDLHPNTVDRTIKKLVKMNFLEEAPVKKGIIERDDGLIIRRNRKCSEIFYRITLSTIEEISEAFIVYKKAIFEDLSVALIIDTLDECEFLPKEVPRRDKSFDRAYNAFFDVFPHPYHV